MTAQLLNNELSTLIQDSKRKYQELRNAAERSVAELKALPQTSEAQLSADLKNRPTFVKPFLLACGTRNSKFAGSAIVCLQRLVLIQALPNDSLKGVLEAFQECSSLAFDIQLKVLQALPFLFQNYSNALSDKLLAAALEVCFSLYSSKTAVVSNTAAAALQQLVDVTFEKVALEDGKSDDTASVQEVRTADGATIVGSAASDAYQLLNDICLMTEGQRPKFLGSGSLSQDFGFELLESVLANHADSFQAHSEQVHVLSLRLMPLIAKILADRISFGTTVRVMRLLQLIISRLLSGLAEECELALNSLNRAVENETTAAWKRALTLELFRELHSNPTLIRDIYRQYDENDQRKNIVRDHLASLVRLASEKPNVIGLGIQTSMSARPRDEWADQVALQAGGIVGTISTSEADNSGISTRWSIPRTPCLELLDKVEPPLLPATYVYALAITCISSFSDGLGKFLLPFTSPKESKSRKKERTPHENSDTAPNAPNTTTPTSRRQSSRVRRVPINPLSLNENVQYPQILTSAHMVDSCWPALLAVSSTFLNATLDSDHYHALIRCFQKYTHVAGLLCLTTPRDAFLTTLAKHSVPAGRGKSPIARANFDRSTQPDSTENSDMDSSPVPSKRSSFDRGSIAMTPRNLLCLRALLNLGIALGPLLHASWSIILETLQQAELLLPKSAKQQKSGAKQSVYEASSQTDPEQGRNDEDFGAEILAAETAASRVIESTSDLPDDAFLDFIKCLNALFSYSGIEDSNTEEKRDGLLSPETPSKKHQRFPSISLASNEGAGLQGNLFVLDKLDQLVQCNASRFTDTKSSECLDVLIKQLETILSNRAAISTVRTKSAQILSDIVVSVATSTESSPGEQDDLRNKMFSAVQAAISALYDEVQNPSKDIQKCNVEIHRTLLEAIRSILERCGDSLQSGWDTAFTIITSAFDRSATGENATISSEFGTKSPSLVRSSYGSLQLVCSDYLSFVPVACFSMLIDALYMFSLQSQDLNISLSTTTFFANVSDFLQHQSKPLSFDLRLISCGSGTELMTIIKNGLSDKPLAALWLLLMLRLKDVTTDQRVEVRHSALHTLFRIFADVGDELGHATWRTCFYTIIRELMKANQQEYARRAPSAEAKKTSSTLTVEWNQTAVVIVDGTAGIFSSNLNIMRRESSFSKIWRELLQGMKSFLDRSVLELSKAVFSGLVSIMEEIEDSETVSKTSVDETWILWKSCNPTSHTSNQSTPNNNQGALLSYLRLLSQIYRLNNSESRMKRAEAVIIELQSCVINANVGAYSTDIDRMTPAQQGVLENLKTIPTESPAALRSVASFVVFLIGLPYDGNPKQEGQSHLAISRRAVEMLQKLVIGQIGKAGLSYNLVIEALNALAGPIHLKYKWYVDGKAPSCWRQATSAALEILEACIPSLLKKQEQEEVIAAFWEQIVRIIAGIVAADDESLKPETNILEDEEFDMSAFKRIQKLTIPTLGSSTIPDTIRQQYAKTIYEKSLIHEPHPDDLARPGEGLLDGLKRNHIGRVNDLVPTPRKRMSYLLLDELFDLVAVHDGSEERVRLAQAAAPYMILRAGLTLKAYVLDQPLRGRAPQPYSEKLEMFHLLEQMVELRCEPKAFTDAGSVMSLHRKHLYQLYPLVTKALRAAFRDDEMQRALGKVLDAVGQDFGV